VDGPKSVNDKVAFVTGGSRGIGKAIAQALIAAGYKVAIGYRQHKAPAESLVVDRTRALTVQIDVSNDDSVKQTISAIENKLGSIDILVNNAGIAQMKPFPEISDHDWEQMLSVNFLGAVRCTRAVLPKMISKHFGRIVNISSVGGQWGGVYQVHYAAAKAALINFTRSMAKIYSHAGISCNAVAPGLIETDMIAQEMNSEEALKRIESIPMGRLGSVEEVASAVIYLCSDSAGYITGQTLNVNGGMYFG
jgi:NAD(P)-dependent dehydrogenase (short-subunit alcohol dehydrogenase family)